MMPSSEPPAYPIRTSVLMPALNAADTLPRALASVQAQSCSDWEVLVVDDGSQDATSACVQQIAARDPRIHLIRHPSSLGAAAARNSALAAARGRYIAFLDADDSWEPQKLDLQLAHMQATGARLSYTGFWRITGTERRAVIPPASVTYDALLRGNCIGCLTAIYDRALCGSRPMPDLRRRHDFALWLDLLHPDGTAYGLTEPLAQYHASASSLSGNKLRAIYGTWIMYRRHVGLSRWRAASCLWAHLVKRLRRG